VIDVRVLRSDLAGVKAAMSRRGEPELADQLDRATELDAEVLRIARERDDLRRRVNDLSKRVGLARREGRAAEAEATMAESRQLGEQEAHLAAKVTEVEAALREVLLRIPNVPHPQVPAGEGEDDNPVVLGPVGLPAGGFAEHQRVPHWELGPQLGILDNERAVKVSGAMFSMTRGLGATLGRALCQLALDRNADAFEEVRPPSLVTSATLTATGQLPKFADDAYAIERDDLWCIPTAEVPLTSLLGGEIVDEADLPVRFMAATPCYRREAGSAGRDTRGLLRVHEFDKVEILAVTTPEQAPGVLDDLLDRAVGTIAELGLPHRVIEICTGDLGQSHHRSLDVEVFAPGADRWLEVSSVSWFSDYQARRADIRYRPSGRRGTEVAHTLNGSALAVPRVLAALLEHNRQPDGSVAIPEVLHPYTRGATVIPAA
jgi:seryl-tRNA synthetase